MAVVTVVQLTCKKHPNYTAMRQPAKGCQACGEIYQLCADTHVRTFRDGSILTIERVREGESN